MVLPNADFATLRAAGYTGSLSDMRRQNLLILLSLTEPQFKTNNDLELQYWRTQGKTGSIMDARHGTAAVIGTNQATNPLPNGNVNGWVANDGAKWIVTYVAGEADIDRQVTADANIAASLAGVGFVSSNGQIILPAVNYQRSVEIWVDATATLGAGYAPGFQPGPTLAAGQWTRVVQQFTGTNANDWPTNIYVNIPGVSTGIHCKMRKAMLIANPGAQSLLYADGNTSGWVWNGTPDASTSTGPVTLG